MTSRENELRELARRKAEKNKVKPSYYFLTVFVVLVIIMMIDEFASASHTSVQTACIEEFFIKGMGQTAEEGAANFSIIGTLTMPYRS